MCMHSPRRDINIYSRVWIPAQGDSPSEGLMNTSGKFGNSEGPMLELEGIFHGASRELSGASCELVPEQACDLGVRWLATA